MAIMKPQVYQGDYFAVNTSQGTEVVTADDVGRTCATHVEALLNYLSGTPDDADELCELKNGWLARMSAPGYLDCTDWTAYPTEAAARAALDDMFDTED
ncbi:hypothetical protein D3C87_687280 [compost metagenome]